MVKIYQTKKLAEFALGGGLGELANDSHLVLQGADAMGVDVVTQKLEVVGSKHTFGKVDENAMLAQSLKYQSKVLLMLFRAGACDRQVVQRR